MKEIEVGYAMVRAARITYVGELGWELYIPSEFALGVYDAIVDAGAEFVQTQFCFDLDLIRAYVDGLDRYGLLERTRILIGLGPISSARSARWMRENLWGTAIPDAVIQRIADAPDETDAGRAVCMELMQALHDLPGVAGVHLMAPRDDAAYVAAMIADSGLQ